MSSDKGHSLKPCPFCQQQPDSRWHGGFGPDDDGGFWGVECFNCARGAPTRFVGVHADNQVSAEACWNARIEARTAEPHTDESLRLNALSWAFVRFFEQHAGDLTRLSGWDDLSLAFHANASREAERTAPSAGTDRPSTLDKYKSTSGADSAGADRIEGEDTVNERHVPAPMSDCLRILRARLSEHLSPAEVRELEEAAGVLELAYPALRELVQRIERCGASVELTQAVVLASDLCSAIGNRWNPRDKYAEQRVREALPTA